MRNRSSLLAAALSALLVLLAACSERLVDPPDQEVRVGIPATAAIAFVSTRDGSEYIYVANADGSNVTRLTMGSQPAWSWDGRKIAFVRGLSGVFVMNANGFERSLGIGYRPSWSPDGSITFSGCSFSGACGIYVVNGDGTGSRLLIDNAIAEDLNPLPGYGGGGVYAPTWSPDGRRMAFLLAAGYMGGAGIWVMNANGSEPRPVPGMWHGGGFGGWVAWDAAWSPDGSRIAATTYADSRDSYTSIAAYDPSSGERQVIHRGSAAFPQKPDWSPDAQHLLFEAFAFPEPAPGAPSSSWSRQRIFLLSLETGELRQLIADAADPAMADYDDYDAAWSRAKR